MIPATLVGPEVRHLQSHETGIKIPCVTAKGLVFMAFEPSLEEKQLLLEGCPVWVVCRGPFVPELTLRVGVEAEVIPFDLRRQAVAENIPGGDEAERAVARLKSTKSDRIFGRMIIITICLSAIYGVFALGAWLG